MADREKVMQWLKICANGCKDGCPYEYKNLVYRVECKADLMSDALDLLTEQEPVKPFIAEDGGRVWWYGCGDCKRSVALGDRFCKHCGRKVLWDD